MDNVGASEIFQSGTSGPATSLDDFKHLIHDAVRSELNAIRSCWKAEIQESLREEIHRNSKNVSTDAPNVMEELRQRLQSLEQNHFNNFNIETRLEDFSAQLHEVKTCQQAQRELVQSLELQAARTSKPRSHLFEQHPSEVSGVTAGIFEADAEELYVFKESIWDIAVLIGTPVLGDGSSCISTLLLLMTLIMQAVFVGIVWFNFSDATINETTIEDARRWRRYLGHDFKTLDPLSGKSLVTMVCQNDQSLQVASAQALLYESVSKYVKPGATGLETVFVGKMLCVVVLVCWLLMVAKEAHICTDLFRAMVSLDRNIDRLDSVHRPGAPPSYKVASVSCKRLILSGIIMSYRLVVASLLCYCGIFFRVYTIDITELVLNAVALEIILNIDELVFNALTPSNTRRLVLKLEPLYMPRWPHLKGVDVKAVIVAVMIPSTIMIVYYEMVYPMVENLIKVADALCGGSQNFVYSDDLLKMTVFATTDPCTAICKRPLSADTRVKSLAVQEAVTHGKQNNSEWALWVGDHYDLQIWNRFSFEQLVSQMSPGLCVDKLLRGPYLHYMRQVMGNSSISDCSDVTDWCSSASFEPELAPDNGKGLMARLFCPQTCECDNAGGKIIFKSGCPSTCTERTHRMYAQRLKVPAGTCPQRSRYNLTNSSDWMAWVAQMRLFAAFRNDKPLEEYSDQLENTGCTGVYTSRASPYCVWDDKYKSVFKGLAYFCPDSCYCYCWHGVAPACPEPCRDPPHRRRRFNAACR